jgi:NCAIR mutase (PurE)-related protein
MVLREPGRGQPPVTHGGKVAIFTAGTSDAGVADEAKAILVEMGCGVRVSTMWASRASTAYSLP